MMKKKSCLVLLLLSVFFLTSCSGDGFTGNKTGGDSDFRQPRETTADPETGPYDPEDPEIELTVLPGEDVGEPAAVGAVSQPTDRNGGRSPVQMELILYFADRKATGNGEPGPYGFVTPVTRHIPATSGILAEAIRELAKGPLPEEGEVDPVLPDTTELRKISIQDGIARIDFNRAFAEDHKGGSLGGTITRQSIVFTAAQFDSVDGVLVTVEGEPWSDGHFIWDIPIYPEDLNQTSEGVSED